MGYSSSTDAQRPSAASNKRAIWVDVSWFDGWSADSLSLSRCSSQASSPPHRSSSSALSASSVLGSSVCDSTSSISPKKSHDICSMTFKESVTRSARANNVDVAFNVSGKYPLDRFAKCTPSNIDSKTSMGRSVSAQN